MKTKTPGGAKIPESPKVKTQVGGVFSKRGIPFSFSVLPGLHKVSPVFSLCVYIYGDITYQGNHLSPPTPPFLLLGLGVFLFNYVATGGA